jgi:glutamate-1-semialdehyde 2,1-aminomutase
MAIGGNSADAALRERAAKVIPGGMYGHMSAKLLPEGYPQFFARGAGAEIWDVDGNRYIDFMCAYGPNLFGYADPEIDAAYVAQLSKGDTLTGPSALMVELAEAMTGQIAHAEWALFCKNGTDATTAAVMSARAVTRKSTLLRARGAYHGAAPWCTPRDPGVAPGDRANQIFFDFNDVASLTAAVAEAGDDLAAIIAQPINQPAFAPQAPPTPEYAQAARALATRAGAMLIVDEVRTGYRTTTGSIWDELGAPPDMSAWGKVLANGHALSALLGGPAARRGAERIYTTGSFWFSAAPMAAALVVQKRVREGAYLAHIKNIGGALRAGLAERADRHGVGFSQTGPETMPLFLFAEDDADFRASYFWCQQMLRRGVYMHPWHNMFVNAAMTEAHVEETLAAADEAFAALAAARASLAPNRVLAAMAAAE